MSDPTEIPTTPTTDIETPTETPAEPPKTIIATEVTEAPVEATGSIPPTGGKPYKTVALVVLFLVLLGSAGTGGYLYWRDSQKVVSEPVAETPQTEQQPTPPLTLTLASPSESSVVQGEEVTIKGQTLPNTTVAYFTDTDQDSVESDAKGNFEGKVALASGINTLTVTAFAESGEEKSVSMNVVYDDQVLAAKNGMKDNPGQAKKNEATGTPAVIGTVDQVSTDSLTVSDNKSKRQVKTSVDQKTKIYNQDKKSVLLNKLKPKDLAAIISTDSATGTNSGQLKKALKIYVREATASAQSKRRAVQGVITAINGQTITLAHQIQRDRTYTIVTNAGTLIKIKGLTDTTLASLVVGQRVVAIGDLNEQGLIVAKRIHVIPGKATGVFDKNPLPTTGVTATPSETIITGTPTPSQVVTPTVTEEPTNTPTPTIAP